MIELITARELLQAPTGISWNSVAEDAGGDDPVQFIEQTNIISRATFLAANACNMPQGLHATEQTEQAITGTSASIGDQVWIDKYGQLNFKCATTPVLSVVSSQWTPMGRVNDWQSIDADSWVITGPYPMQRHLTNTSRFWGGLKMRPAMVQVTYVSGWANAVLTADATSGAGVELSVDTTYGMSAGQSLQVADGSDTETVTVTQVVDGETVMVDNLANDHDAGVGVSAVPPDIKQAVIFICMSLVRERGSVTLSMTSSGADSTTGSSGVGDGAMADALKILSRYTVQS